MVLADSCKVSRAPHYLGYSRGSESFIYRTITVYGAAFQLLQLSSSHLLMESRYPAETIVSSVWALPLSLAATKGVTVLFSFPPGNKMFQFPGLPYSTLCIQVGIAGIHPAGLPHSETHGS